MVVDVKEEIFWVGRLYWIVIGSYMKGQLWNSTVQGQTVNGREPIDIYLQDASNYY